MFRRNVRTTIIDGEVAARQVIQRIESHVRPDFRKALACALTAVIALVVGHLIGGPHARHVHVRIAVYICAVLMVGFGALATRLFAAEIARVSEARSGAATATPLRVFTLLVGYLAVVLSAFDLLDVPIEHLLVGGAVTGIIVGIAAQQSLGNVFAGLVLLFARPYVPGERILVRSGALGGPFEGTVTTVGLLYTTMSIDGATVNLPNSGLLAAAVGPAPVPPPDDDEQAELP